MTEKGQEPIDVMESAEELLDKLLKHNGVFFDQQKATTRHEVWFLASALSNLVLIKEIRELRSQIEDLKDDGGGKSRIVVKKLVRG